MAKRRSDGEQRRFVAAWVKSAASAAAFAAQEGVSKSSLFRWERMHRRKGSSSRSVELVEAVPLDTTGPWSWEVETPRGCVRGRDELDAERVRAIIGALVGSSR